MPPSMYSGFDWFLSPAVVIPNIRTSRSGQRCSIAFLTISVWTIASLLWRVPSVNTFWPSLPGTARAISDRATSGAIAGSSGEGKQSFGVGSPASNGIAIVRNRRRRRRRPRPGSRVNSLRSFGSISGQVICPSGFMKMRCQALLATPIACATCTNGPGFFFWLSAREDWSKPSSAR